jgi:hypothetical protein
MGGSLKAGRPWGWWDRKSVWPTFLGLAIPKSRRLEVGVPKRIISRWGGPCHPISPRPVLASEQIIIIHTLNHFQTR